VSRDATVAWGGSEGELPWVPLCWVPLCCVTLDWATLSSGDALSDHLVGLTLTNPSSFVPWRDA
jgi:hypothetical protein